MSSFLGPYAPTEANWVLFFELAVGVLLIIGGLLARAGHIRVHKWIQCSMVFVNIPIILAWMVPEYQLYVLPLIPDQLAQAAVWIPTLMLVAGATAEALGVYIVLAAGTNLLPPRLRFRRYKLWMRTELLLWWIVLLAGVATYYEFYYPH
ncbi:MAG: hypothetical protein WB778_09715 [Thermoplasmata archaeon]